MTMISYLFRFQCPRCGSIFPPEDDATIATYPENFQNGIRNDLDLMNRYKEMMPAASKIAAACSKIFSSKKVQSPYANVTGIHTHTRYLCPDCVKKYVEEHPMEFAFLDSLGEFLDENKKRQDAVYGLYCKELSRLGQQYATEYACTSEDDVIVERLQKAILAGKETAIKAHRKDLRKSVRSSIASSLESYVTANGDFEPVATKYADYVAWYGNAVADIQSKCPPVPMKILRRLVPGESRTTNGGALLSVHIGCQTLNMADALGYSMPVEVGQEDVDAYVQPVVEQPPFKAWYEEKAQKTVDAAVEAVMKRLEATVG